MRNHPVLTCTDFCRCRAFGRGVCPSRPTGCHCWGTHRNCTWIWPTGCRLCLSRRIGCHMVSPLEDSSKLRLALPQQLDWWGLQAGLRAATAVGGVTTVSVGAGAAVAAEGAGFSGSRASPASSSGSSAPAASMLQINTYLYLCSENVRDCVMCECPRPRPSALVDQLLNEISLSTCSETSPPT